MFACCKPQPEPEENPLIVDVLEVIRNKAWQHFVSTCKAYQRPFLRRKQYKIEVPENYFLFEQIEQSVTPRKNRRAVKQLPPASGNNNAAGASEEAAGEGGKGKDLLKGNIPGHRQTNPEAVSVDTMFANDTAKTQTYEFRFEKNRTTSIEVSYQKGFSIGTRANFSIGMPKLLADGGLELETETQYEVTKSQGQTFEESMAMEATSTIVVGPKACYVAQVQLEERTVVADFLVRTRMSMPQMRAPIYIRRKSDDQVMSVYNIRILKDVFTAKTAPSAEKVVGEDGKLVAHAMDFVVSGVLKGSLALNHKINVTSDEPEADKLMARQYKVAPGGGAGEEDGGD